MTARLMNAIAYPIVDAVMSLGARRLFVACVLVCQAFAAEILLFPL